MATQAVLPEPIHSPLRLERIATLPRVRALAWDGDVLFASRGYTLMKMRPGAERFDLTPVARYEPAQLRRLSVAPGLTGPWQVAGRSEVDFETWMQLDLDYVDHWSLLTDLRILVRTIPAVVSGRGAW